MISCTVPPIALRKIAAIDRRQRPPGGVTGRDQWEVLLGDAEVGPPEAQRVEDLGGQDVANVFAGGRIDDLAHQRTPGQRVVDVHQSRPVQRPQLPSCSWAYSWSSARLQVRPGPGGEGHAGAVGQHVPDRGAVLAVTRVAGDVLADPVVERETPRSTSMCTTVAVMPLAAEYTQNGVSVVTGIFSASGESVGALPQPWPIARLSTTRPCRRMQSWIAGCIPAWYQCRAACQMRSTAALSISEWSSAPIAVTASRSAGTRILPSGVTSERVRAVHRQCI